VTGACPGRGFGPGEERIRAICARRFGGITVIAALLTAVVPASAQMPDDAFRTTLSGLRGASYPDKEAIVNTVAEGGHASTRDVLTAFLEDRLYIRASDSRVFVAPTAEATEGGPVTLLDPVSLEEAGKAAAADLELVGTNNRLRRVLRTTVARFALSHPDAGVRLQAVTEMQRALDDATVDMLREQAARETDHAVKAELETALALAALDGVDPAARLRAVETLRTRVKPDVRNRLAQLTESSDGTFVESDPQVRAAAVAAVAAIDNTLWWYSGVEMLFFGLSLGSILVLVAIGLAITFGVMGVINMAHGELMMLGAYTTYVVQLLMPQHIAVSVLVAIPAAFLVSGAAGVLLETTVIRRLYGRPLETLLATFGVSLVLQQLVRTLFTANNRAVETPAWMSGTLQIIEGLSITLNRVYILGFAMAVFAILLIVLRRTRLGLDIRAVAQNRAMARAMGIRSAWVDAMTFGLGSGIAGVAGVALSQLTNVGPDLGQAYIIDSFMVVVFGGVGNLWGTLIGGLSLGVVNKLLEPFAGAVLAKIFVLIGLILFIQRRPRGLFPQTGRAAEGL
jgi:urea transport system permease protein